MFNEPLTKMPLYTNDEDKRRPWHSHWKVITGAVIGFSALMLLYTGKLPVPSHFTDESTISDRGSIDNQTLGFEKIYVINLPSRPDEKATLTLAEIALDMKFDFFKPIDRDSVPDEGLPPGADQMEPGPKGLLLTTIAIYQHMVENNIGSALIMEDDADWDIRIRDQLFDFAKASRELNKRADQQRSMELNHTSEGTAIHFEDIIDERPSSKDESPYGSSWDVLWLGHIGMRAAHDDDRTLNTKYRDFVVQHDDPTVVQYSQQFSLDDSIWNIDLASRPDHTRLYHPAIEGVGTQAYAISQLGARHLLHSFYASQPAGPIDFAIRDACTDKFNSGPRLCIATSPSLFSQFKNKGNGRGDSNMHESGGGGYWREEAETRNIRFSTRLNLGELLEEKRWGGGRANIQEMYADDESDGREWTNWD